MFAVMQRVARVCQRELILLYGTVLHTGDIRSGFCDSARQCTAYRHLFHAAVKLSVWHAVSVLALDMHTVRCFLKIKSN